MDEGECAQRVGGSAFIPANLMANLGLRVGLVSCWGTPLTKSTFAAPNLDLTGVIRRPEPAVQITLKYEKQNLCELRVSDRITRFLTESQIPRNYYQAKFFYLTPTPAALLCDVANEAFAKGARVVFTPKEDFPSVGKSRTMQRLLAKCFMCFVNERELDRLTGATGVSGISILHSLGVSIVVATFGAQGAVIATPQVSWKVAPSAISKAKDVVGAGDCFAAGMLAALSRDVDLRRASAFAGELTAWWLANRIEREPEVLHRFASELTRFRSN